MSQIIPLHPAPPLVQVDRLNINFTGQRKAHALTDVSFELQAGHVLGLLGESGSGKSVMLRSLLRLHPAVTTQVSGRITVGGQDVLSLKGRALDNYRGGTTSMVFQEPGLAFDPVYRIGQQITEAIRAHHQIDETTARQRALQMLDRVQIAQAKRRFDAYPHELSGGMRQRAMIALALATEPRVLLADEPTTALDATVQIQILLLLRQLQQETGMAVIFVTHDMGAAVEMADRLAIMYAGRIVETGTVKQIVQSPQHPYTAGLLASTVSAASRGKPLPAIPGSPPDVSRRIKGCAFAPRCTSASDTCREQIPLSIGVGIERGLSCWHPMSVQTEVA